jgi:transcriptional regulator with XRE-family HTH domain
MLLARGPDGDLKVLTILKVRYAPIWELRGLDMTQVDFVGSIGVRQSYLSAIEHGRNEVGAEVLLVISQEFDKSLEWLLTGGE